MTDSAALVPLLSSRVTYVRWAQNCAFVSTHPMGWPARHPAPLRMHHLSTSAVVVPAVPASQILQVCAFGAARSWGITAGACNSSLSPLSRRWWGLQTAAINQRAVVGGQQDVIDHFESAG